MDGLPTAMGCATLGTFCARIPTATDSRGAPRVRVGAFRSFFPALIAASRFLPAQKALLSCSELVACAAPPTTLLSAAKV